MGMVKGSSRDVIGSLEWEEIYYKQSYIWKDNFQKFSKTGKRTQANHFNIWKKGKKIFEKKETVNAVSYLKKKMIGLF